MYIYIYTHIPVSEAPMLAPSAAPALRRPPDNLFVCCCLFVRMCPVAGA